MALAQGDLGGKLRSGRDVTVPAGETVATDLYVAAGTVTVDGTVQGDLVVTGGSLTLNGTVDGDVLAAGGTIRVGGTSLVTSARPADRWSWPGRSPRTVSSPAARSSSRLAARSART